LKVLVGWILLSIFAKIFIHIDVCHFENQNLINMNILCPTDFSEHSLLALDYAIDLSNKLGARLHLITAYSVPRSTGSFRSLDDSIRESVGEELGELVNVVLPKISTGITPEYHIMEGNSGRVITQFAAANDIDIVVMGTQGKGSLSNLFIGSVAKKVFENSSVPVIAIPASFREGIDKNKIVLALDEKVISNENNYKFLSNFVKNYGATLDIYHLLKPSETLPFTHEAIDRFKDILGEVVTESGDEVVSSIRNYLDNTHTGMLVMVRRPHSFWSKLFTDSSTTAQLAATKVPIMILPE